MASTSHAGAVRPPVPPIRIDFTAEDRRWITERIDEVLANGQLTLGKYGEQFEAEFARQSGAKHAIAVNSGTSSLEIILRILKVAGRDVLVLGANKVGLLSGLYSSETPLPTGSTSPRRPRSSRLIRATTTPRIEPSAKWSSQAMNSGSALTLIMAEM